MQYLVAMSIAVADILVTLVLYNGPIESVADVVGKDVFVAMSHSSKLY